MIRVQLSCGCLAFFGEEILEKTMAEGGVTPCFRCNDLVTILDQGENQ